MRGLVIEKDGDGGDSRADATKRGGGECERAGSDAEASIS